MTAAGPTVFAPFPAGSDYFAADKAFMPNLRVSGLHAMLAMLRAAGVDAPGTPDIDDPDMGRFARIHDPEGNPIELWEPSAA